MRVELPWPDSKLAPNRRNGKHWTATHAAKGKRLGVFVISYNAELLIQDTLRRIPEDVWREVLEVNMTGTFLCCQVIGGAMAKLGRGSIVNVGSIYGMLSPVQDIYAYKEELTGTPFVKPVAYCASKPGLYNFTRYLATYWGKKGVRVNILTPSGVRRDSQDAQFQANYCQRMPIGRMAEEDEYNGALVFLASDASRYMTGSNLVVDGGWTAW